jgi:hypothetical protein
MKENPESARDGKMAVVLENHQFRKIESHLLLGHPGTVF